MKSNFLFGIIIGMVININNVLLVISGIILGIILSSKNNDKNDILYTLRNKFRDLLDN